MEGDYIFEKGENLEAYFKAIGDESILEHLGSYKVHICKTGTSVCTSERYGDLGQFRNTFELDVEGPYFCLGDKRGITSY
jgi:hypothetical protein